MPLDIVSRIMAARGGDSIVDIRNEWADSVEVAANKFGLASSPGIYFEVSRQEAKAVLKAILAEDMAYSCELMPQLDAEKLASAFVGEFIDEAARYYTNGDFGKPREEPGVGPGWTPATDATFDTGILVVTGTRIACAWFMDED